MNGSVHRRKPALFGTCLLGVLAAWWLARSASSAPSDNTSRNQGRASREQRSSSRHAGPTPARDVLRLLAQMAKNAPTEDSEQEGPRDRHPHPITPDHQRLYRDVDLLHAADLAIRGGDYAEARRLLAEHHRELPGMSRVEEEGLLLLADCAERPSANNIVRVQTFYDRHTSSTIRRQLRRACLER